MGMVDFVEPFTALLNQGQVINQGKTMSKSLGNGVNLGEQIDAYGVDAVRLTLVFAGPPEDDIDWADMSPAGSLKFLQRAWRLSGDVTSPGGHVRRRGDVALRKVTHRTVTTRRELIEAHRFNVMVARIMELVNATRKAIDSGCGPADPAVREAAEAVAILLSLVAPYTAEEMWERLGHEPTVARAGWPTVDERCWSRTRSPASCRCRARSAPGWRSPPTSPTPTWRPRAGRPAGPARAGRQAVRKVIVARPSWSTSSPADRPAPPARRVVRRGSRPSERMTSGSGAGHSEGRAPRRPGCPRRAGRRSGRPSTGVQAPPRGWRPRRRG